MPSTVKIIGVPVDLITTIHIHNHVFYNVSDVSQQVHQHRSSIRFNYRYMGDTADQIFCATVWEDFILAVEQKATHSAD